MATSEHNKAVRLTLVRGGLDGQPLSAEERLDREVRERVAAIRGANGRVPSRACYRIAEGTQWPGRQIARRVREMKRQRVSREAVRAALVEPLSLYVDRVFGYVQGDLRPAA
jgi:hypothetical protein